MTTVDQEKKITIVGQEKIIKSIEAIIKSRNGETLPHMIFTGPSGMGKSSLANYVAEKSGFPLIIINCPTIKDVKDIDKIILTIETEGQILFLDEIHAMPKKAQESLYTVMENFNYHFMQDESDEPITWEVPKFTVIGATNNIGKLKESFKNRFVYYFAIHPYSNEEIAEIIKEASEITIDSDALAEYCRGTPRRAKNLLTWINDFCKAENIATATHEVIQHCLEYISVYRYGLTDNDIKYLKFLLARRGDVIGLSTISSHINLDQELIENTIEPFLLKEGFIYKKPKGRCINLAVVDKLKEIL